MSRSKSRRERVLLLLPFSAPRSSHHQTLRRLLLFPALPSATLPPAAITRLHLKIAPPVSGRLVEGSPARKQSLTTPEGPPGAPAAPGLARLTPILPTLEPGVLASLRLKTQARACTGSELSPRGPHGTQH